MRAGTDPQHDSIFTKGPVEVLDHATTENRPRRRDEEVAGRRFSACVLLYSSF
jgi:hypothetical protein